jgi:hypothetical protein
MKQKTASDDRFSLFSDDRRHAATYYAIIPNITITLSGLQTPYPFEILMVRDKLPHIPIPFAQASSFHNQGI